MLTTSISDVSALGACDGIAAVLVTGGTESYSYLWSDGQTTAQASGLCTRNYCVTVTDINGCTIYRCNSEYCC